MNEPSSPNDDSSSLDVLVLICTQSFTAETLVDDVLVETLCSAGFSVESRLVDEAGYDWAGVVTHQQPDNSASPCRQEAKVTVIVASTFGDGDPPSHASEFAKWLGSELQDANTEAFSSLFNYCVFGLGDRTYAHFAEFGKYIDKKLQDRGYHQLLPFEAGDAAGGNQTGEFTIWCSRLLQMLKEVIGPRNVTIHNYPKPFPSGTGADWQKCAIQPGSVAARVVSATELTLPAAAETNNGSSERSVVEVCLSVPVKGHHVQPGDHVGICPRNNMEVVDRALKWLEVEANTQTKIMKRMVDRNGNYFWEPMEITAHALLTEHVDIAGRATPTVLRALLPFVGTLELRALARDLTHVATMTDGVETSSVSGGGSCSLFDSWVAGRWLTALDLAILFECRPSLQAFAKACGSLQPRLYSIASVLPGGDDETMLLKLCVSIVEGGLCSNYLKKLSCSEAAAASSEAVAVEIFLSPSRFRFVPVCDTPSLLVATGSGVGPYIGFLEQYMKWKLLQGNHCSVNPPINLYYGCRTEYELLYRQRLDEFSALGCLDTHYAFSRIHGQPKIYVQDLLRQDAAKFWNVVFAQKGRVYVCGRLEMLDGVKQALVDVAVSAGGMDEVAARAAVKEMEDCGIILTDCWSVYQAPKQARSRSAANVDLPPHIVLRLERHHAPVLKHTIRPHVRVLSNVPKWPSYLRLVASGEFEYRIKRATDMWSACVACGRNCETNRLSSNPDDWGECRVGTHAIVASVFPHFGEEDCLVGTKGSGTIFFGACNLKCMYCQNWELSAMDEGEMYSDEQLALSMLALQDRKCHNINFVSPTHNVLPILRAVLIAARRGLRLPLVWNTGGYDSVASLRLLDGIVDIYMPDAKYASRVAGRKLSKVDNYPEINQAAIKEMYRQVGDLQIEKKTGLARRGVLVRHLVLPCDLAGTCDVAAFLAKEVSRDTYTNVMGQYRPEHKAVSDKKFGLARRPTRKEVSKANQEAKHAGLRRLDGEQSKKRSLDW